MKIKSEELTNLVGLGLFVLGILVAGETFHLPVSNQLALGLEMCGFGLAIAFLDGLITGRISSIFGRDFEWGYYEGLVARLWGGLMLVIGLLLAVGGFSEWRFPGSVKKLFETSWGLALGLLAAGVVVILFSLVKLLRPMPPKDTWVKRLAQLPGWIYFGALLLVGGGLLVMGLLQLIVPGMLKNLVEQVITLP